MSRVTELCQMADDVLNALTRCVENADTKGAIYHARNLAGIAEEITDTLKAKKLAPRISKNAGGVRVDAETQPKEQKS